MTTAYRNANQLADAGLALMREGRFEEALDLLDRDGPRFPEAEPRLLYLRSCLLARLGRTPAALDAVEAALERGHWYGERVLRESPSWAGLQGHPRFEALAARHLERDAQVRAGARPLTLVRRPEGGEGPFPPLVVLHGNGEDAGAALEGWSGAGRGG